MLYILLAVLMIAMDQGVKYWALTSLQAQQTIPLIDGVFHLTYVENRGAAFSMFAQFDSRWILLRWLWLSQLRSLLCCIKV